MAENRGRKGDDVLAIALAAGKTVRDAAAEAGLGETTAARRWAEPEFRQRVTALRGEMTSRALGRLTDGMTAAADTLRALLAAESESVRLGACRALLEMGCRLRESVELEQRLQSLEERALKHEGSR